MVKSRPHLKQIIFKPLESSFFKIILNMKYDIKEEKEDSVTKDAHIRVNMLIHRYSPLSFIGKNVLR